MSAVEENWRAARPNIRERTKFMLNNSLFSDVKFVVRKSDGESESTKVISAHKFMLSIGSPVFEAMFYGELAETRDSIELPDCEYESLLELFRYMYSDEVNLSGSNVMGVLYLAKKYIVPTLVEKCTEYLRYNLHPSNVFSILPSALKFEEETDLVDRCWKVIDEHTEAALKSDGFATIERPLLEAIVERDTLNIAEVELFKGVIEWATKQSEKLGMVANGQEKRRIIGERIIKAIRFPLVTEEEFNSVVLKSRVLVLGEVKFKADFNSVQNIPIGFSETKRSGPRYLKRCCKYRSVMFGWINNGRKSSLSFSADHDIRCHGVYLFGSEDNDYSVTLVLRDDLYGSILASSGGAFSSIRHTTSRYYGFDVLLNEPIFLRKGVVYCLEAFISGPKSWYGIQGNRTVQCSGMTFTFFSANEGQFGELIFSPSN